MEDCIETGKDITNKMRNDNYEKFKALVRMHLSFELDLNTEELDLPCHEIVYYEKGKIRKWNRLTKSKIKTCTSNNKSPEDVTNIILSFDLINKLIQLKSIIMEEENLIQEGIFRRTGAISRQNELRCLIMNQQEFDLNTYTVHDIATVFKGILADLSEPLLTDAHYPAHCQIADICNDVDSKKEFHLLNIVQLLILLLPEENRILLEHIIQMLNTTAKFEAMNKMSIENIATLFCPHICCPRNMPPEVLHYVSKKMKSVLSFLIAKGARIFDVPSKLATDIRAYYEEKRKRTMSPEYTLDESMSDVSTVNTIFTFVDREKTKEAHDSNPTDQALASLYAHIQTLPESSKKKKLIKQFNKENGQGTPLQLIRMKNTESNRISTKSISDSIKKHIFHKGIMNRTPKRSNLSVANFRTPEASTPKIPKLRVLFQTPNSDQLQNTPKTSTASKTILKLALKNDSPMEIDEQSESFKGILNSADKSRNISNLKEKSETKENDVDTKICSPSTSSISSNFSDLKSRYKSEPNLTQIYNKDLSSNASCVSNFSKVLKSKLGLSMGNLRLPFYASDSTNSVKQTDSLFIDRKSSLTNEISNLESDSRLKLICERENNELHFHEENEDHIKSFRNVTPRAELNGPNYLCDLNTPRVSMSPITKSTQRMPKAMQESIMTPRSRKPVMLMTTLRAVDQGNLQNSQLKEIDEDQFSSRNLGIPENKNENCVQDFKEYLLTRDILTDSPVDDDFHSQSGDFCNSVFDFDELDESKFSPSLLYCLDGNQPSENSVSDAESSQMYLTSKMLMVHEEPGETSL